jgi:hypothetical protein
MSATLNKEQEAEMIRLKQYFPYRIVWATSDLETGKFEAHASFDKRQMNKALRDGKSHVFKL